MLRDELLQRRVRYLCSLDPDVERPSDRGLHNRVDYELPGLAGYCQGILDAILARHRTRDEELAEIEVLMEPDISTRRGTRLRF